MIQIKKAFENLTPDEYHQLLDVPVWLALLAAYTGDGKVSEDEKAEAVKLAHMRTYTAPNSLKEFYEMVDAQFETRFNKLNSRVPEGEEDKIIFLKAQVRKSHSLLPKIDKDIAAALQDSMSSFYNHIFSADKSFFQYFALPVLSNRLDKQSGKYRFGESQ